MDVFNISAGQAPKAAQSGSVEKNDPLVKGGERSRKSAAVGDSFATSSAARQVQGLVDRLSSSESLEVRSDLVEGFRALMGTGGLDTFDAAERAAAAMLGEASG